MAIARREMTLEAFLALPEQKPALEFEDGVVLEKVTPKPVHGRIQSTLGRLIDNFAAERGLAWSFTETRFSVAGRSYVPDLSVYRLERVPVDERGELSRDFDLPPDLAVEIVSPGQSATALVRRCIWYTEHGVTLALLVDPEDRSILSFRHNQPPVALRESDRIDMEEIVPGFRLTVNELMGALSKTGGQTAS